jgi:mono/diheme cytochrome c family protein
MKSYKPFAKSIVIALAMFILIPNVARAADDAASIYRSKCAACHGVDGLASLAIAKKQSVPSYAEARIQKAPNAELENFVLSGGKQKKASHAYASKGVSKDDAANLVVYIKSLGKKK